MGSALSNTVVSKHPSEYGPLLDAVIRHRKESDPGMNAEIMKACIVKAPKMSGPDQYDMYVQAAKIGQEEHAGEIKSYAESLIRSEDEGVCEAGRKLLRTLNESMTEPFHIDFTVE